MPEVFCTAGSGASLRQQEVIIGSLDGEIDTERVGEAGEDISQIFCFKVLACAEALVVPFPCGSYYLKCRIIRDAVSEVKCWLFMIARPRDSYPSKGYLFGVPRLCCGVQFQPFCFDRLVKASRRSRLKRRPELADEARSGLIGDSARSEVAGCESARRELPNVDLVLGSTNGERFSATDKFLFPETPTAPVHSSK
ncbi:hypothetical protein CXZ05_10250 [Arthrobacter sp. AFG20]|nr:hypothetical protein CXZ05_10250 [Arthrobacter sp. AFG20]